MFRLWLCVWQRFLEGITKGALLEVTGLKDTTQREDIAAVFNKYSTIAWQDFKKGDPTVSAVLICFF